MSKNNLPKNVMAVAFAVAGLTFAGGYAEANDYDNPTAIMRTINSATKHKSGLQYKKVAPKRLFSNRFANKSYTTGVELTGFATPVSTLDEIKSEEITYLESTHHYTISTTKGSHTHSFKIDNTTYYYTPDENDTTIVNLANTGYNALTTGSSSDYVFTDGTKYWKYDTSKLKASVFEYGEGTSEDYNVAYNDGTTISYYKTNLKPSEMKISDNITFEKKTKAEVTTDDYVWSDNITVPLASDIITVESGSGKLQNAYGAVRFNLPHNGSTETQYYKWTWDNPNKNQYSKDSILELDSNVSGGYFWNLSNNSGGAIYNESSNGYSITANFIDNSAYNGGAIYNYGTISSITGDFIDNETDYYGGAIYNDSGTIGSITGDFIGNLTTTGDSGAIYNTGTISSITGDFIGNSATGYGGAIYNEYGTISSITGDFIGNSTEYQGGAIYNEYGTISSITGDFIGNLADNGGAIYNLNDSTISSITGNFIGNSATYTHARGGAIANYGTISSITGDFIGNSVTGTYAQGGAINNISDTISSITGDFIGNSVTGTYAQGGAIRNYNSTINSIMGSFTGNSATGTSAYGGAIFNGNISSGVPAYDANSKITFTGNSTFIGNYVDNNGTITPNSIYNAGIITIANGVAVTINDGYDSLNAGKLNIGTSANSGSIFNLSVDNGTLQTDNLGAVTNYGTINWDLDIDLTNTTSDKITISSLSGTNSIIIRAINLITGTGSDEIAITLTDNNTLKSAYVLSDNILSNITKATGVDYTVTSVKYENGQLIFNSASNSDINDYIQENEDGTVTVTDDYEFSDNETWTAGKTDAQRTFKTTIATIDGEDYTLTAEDGAKGMIIGEDTDLKIEDLTFSNFTTNATNGVLTVLAGNKLTAEDITISGINDTTGNNWAVINYGTFSSDPSTYEGAIANYRGATATITGDTFQNIDRTGFDGGAIYNEGDDTLHPGVVGTLTLNDVTVTGNKAQNGGALYNAGTATINGGTFSNNIATALGGAIYSATDITINATDSAVLFSGNKQAYVDDTNYTVNDIYMAGTSSSTPITLTLNSKDTTNTLTLNGGVDGSYYNVDINSETDHSGLVTINTLTNADEVTLNRGTLTLNGDSGANTLSVVNDSTLNANSTNGLIISTLSIGDGKTLTNNSTSKLTVTGTLTNGSSADSASTRGTIANAGTLSLAPTSGTMTNNGDITGNGTTIIGGTVVFATGTTLAATQDLTISANKSLTANVASLPTATGANAISNAGTLTLFSQETAGSAATYISRVISGSGTTVFNRNVTVNADIETAIDIATYNNGVSDYYANVTVANGNKLGTNTQLITVNENNTLTMESASDLQNTVSNAGILNLQGGTLSQNIDGVTVGTDTTYGTLNITDDTTFSSSKTVVTDTLSLTDAKTFTNNGNVTVNGTLTNPATGEIVLSGTTSTLNLVNDGAMTNAGTISGTGTLNVGDGTASTVLTNSGLISSVVNVYTGATLNTAGVNNVTTPTSGLNSSVTNAGTLELTGGTLVKTVSGVGHTDIKGNVTFANTVSQTINVLSGKLTSSAGYIGGNVDNTGANSLELTGGNLAKVVSSTSNDGTTDITGTVTLVSGGAINEAITISGTGASLTTTDASRIGGTVTNEVANGLILQGGTLSQNVTMTGTIGSTKIQTGDVIINSANSITQAINIESGSLTANANSIGGAVTNEGTLNLVGGTLTNTVSGMGNVNIGDGTTTAQSITNNSSITGDISVKSNGILITSASNISDTDDNIANAGVLRLTDGRLLDKVTNTTGAIVEIAGDVVVNNDDRTGAGEFSGGSLKLSSGTLDLKNVTDATSGDIDLSANGLIANGGTLSVQDGNYGDIKLGDVNTDNSALNIKIDADFTGTPTTSGIIGQTDKIVSSSVSTAANKIIISDIKVTADPVATEFKAQIADSSLANAIDVSATTLTGTDTSIGNVLLNAELQTDDTTWLVGTHSDLDNAITSSISQKIYSMGDNEIDNSSGVLILSGNSLSITGNNKTITSTDSSNSGINVNGKILSIADATIGNSTNGFKTAIDNTTAGGTVNLTDITMTGNTTDIANAGTLNFANTGTNTNSINTISGMGDTNVNSGSTTVNTSLAQGTVNVGDSVTPNDANLTVNGTMAVTALNINTSGSKFTNNGGTSTTPNTVTGTLTNAGTVENTGFLIVGTIDNDNILNNNGTLSITTAFTNDGTVTNEGSITGSAITNNKTVVNQNGGSISVAINNETATSSVDNKSDSIISGAINNNYTGASVDNAGTLSGAVSNFVAGTTINNTGLISGAVNNVASVNNNAGGTITGDITNAGTLTNVETSTTKGILANVVNTGTFTNSGYAGGTGKTVTNNGTGIINNTGTIASSITNNATVNTVVSGFTGGIINDGTVNLAGTTTLQSLGSAITNGTNETGITNIEGAVSTGGYNISQATVNIGSNGTATPVSGTLTNTDTINANVVLTSANATLANSGTINGNLNNNGGNVTNYISTTDGTVTGNVVNKSGTITTNASNIATASTSTIQNDSTLSLTGGTISKEIAKYSTGGTVEITDNVNIASSGSITDNEIKLTAGTFDVSAKSDSSGNIDFTTGNIGTKLVANGGTLSVQDGKMGTISLGTVDTATYDKNLNIAIDADFVNGTTPTARGIEGSADIITVASLSEGANNNKIHISDIRLDTSENHPIGTEFTVQIADGTIAKAAMDLTGTTITSYRSGAGNILLTYDSTSGYITGKHSTLNDAIESSIDTKMYFMDGDSYTTVIDGSKTLGGNSLAITTNGNDITLDTSSDTTVRDGIVIANANQTLSIIGTKDDIHTTNTTISGFKTAIDNTAGGTVNLKDVTMSGNTTDIVNDGEGANGVFLTGTSNINKITSSTTGKGLTTIGNADGTTDYVTIGEISQKNINILSDGVLNISADKLQTTAGADNAGKLNLSGTTVAGNFTTLASDITDNSNSGETNITGNVTIGSGTLFAQTTVNLIVGSSLSLNGSTINADKINLNSAELILANGATIADKTGLSTTAIDLKQTDTTLSQSSITINAVTADTILQNAIITSSDISGYTITAHSENGYTSTINNAIANATSITADDGTSFALTEKAMNSTTAPVSMGNGSSLTLANNGTDTAGATMSSSVTGTNYTVDAINPSATDSVDLESSIAGADSINVKRGQLNIELDNNGDIGTSDVTLANNVSSVAFTTNNDYTVTNDITGGGEINDYTTPTSGSVVQLNGNGTNQFSIASNIEGATVVISNGELLLPDENRLTTNPANLSNVAVASDGILNTMNNQTTAFNDIVFADNSRLKIDANIFTYKTDSFVNPTELGNEKLSDISVQGLDKIYNTKSVNLTGGTGLANLQADAGLSDLISSSYSNVVTPVRLLIGQVTQTNDGLMLQFVPKGGGYESFNSAVLPASVAAQIGGYTTQLHSYDEAFRNMDMHMLSTKAERQAMKIRNRFATANKDLIYDPTVNQYENKAGWFRPYATFENVGLDNGPDVSNVAYGSYAGAESEMYDLGHGWDGMWGVYVGYNGSHQTFGNHNSIYQNGGTLGLVGMVYKDNFFTGLTINASASGAEATTMYGSENFSMLMAGIASKTGYNWELANGKFIVQPSVLASYSFVNTFDYKNAAGINISSDPLHAIQIELGVKLIGNLKNGWQPYAGVSVVINIMDKTDFHANEVALPDMSIKPFVKYGIGVRKSWGERFTAFFQTYLTNGGRNGVGLQAGLRWLIGSSSAKTNAQKAKTSTKKTQIK